MARQRRRARQQSPTDLITTLDRGLSYAQLAFLLPAIFLVPLIVLPESSFADITSTSKATTIRFFGSLLTGILLSRLLIRMMTRSGWASSQHVSLKASRPTYFVLLAAAAVTLVSIISTMLSFSPGVSLWRRIPAGFEAGEYTALMYVVFAIATFVSVRELESIERLWATLAITGFAASLVGVFQFHGIAFLDIAQTHHSHTTDTAGNPIFFGALLVLLAPVSMAYLISRFERAPAHINRYWLATLFLVTGSFTVSLVTTVSRGPLLGWVVGLAVFALVAFRCGSINRAKLPVGVVVASIIGFALLTTVYDPALKTYVTSPPTDTSGSETSEEATGDKFGKFKQSSTVRLRFQYWKLATGIALERPDIPYAKNLPSAVRWLVGYGPDSYRYVATAEAGISNYTSRFTAAHNDPINRLVEQGLLGFIAWMTLWLAIAFALWRLAQRATKSNSLWLAAALAAALSARFVEQLTGSPTAGDVFTFWIFVGFLAIAVFIPNTATIPGDLEQEILATRNASSKTEEKKQIIVGSTVAIVLVVAIFISWNTAGRFFFVNNAGSVLFNAAYLAYDEADDQLKQATNLAPEVASYWHVRADLAHGKADSTASIPEQLAARQTAYEFDKKAYDANPLELGNLYRLAFSVWELGKFGDEEKQQETVDIYRRLTTLAPSDTLAAERFETLYNLLNP